MLAWQYRAAIGQPAAISVHFAVLKLFPEEPRFVGESEE